MIRILILRMRMIRWVKGRVVKGTKDGRATQEESEMIHVKAKVAERVKQKKGKTGERGWKERGVKNRKRKKRKEKKEVNEGKNKPGERSTYKR